MNPSEPALPSSTEFCALKVVWRHGRITAAALATGLRDDGQSADDLAALVEGMVARGFIHAVPGTQPEQYETALDQEQTCVWLLRQTADQQFGGSMQKLVQHFIDKADVPEQTTDKAKRLLDLLEE